MRRTICFFATCILFVTASVNAVEDAETKGNLIGDIKKQLWSNKATIKNEGIMAVKEYGVEKFVKSHDTEHDQYNLVLQVSTGSSKTESSMVRADMLVLLLDSKFEKVIIKAAERLAWCARYCEQPDAFKKLYALMGSKNPEVRLAAIQTIKAIGKGEAFEPRQNIRLKEIIVKMEKYFDDKNPEVILEMFKIYPSTVNKQAIKRIINLTGHKDPRVRQRAFAFFANNEIIDKKMREEALKTLGDKDESPRPQVAASRYLGVIKEKRAVPLMSMLLKKYEGKEKTTEDIIILYLKKNICNALSKIGTEEALKHCVDFLQSDEPLEVLAVAGTSIETITGLDLGFETPMVPAQKQIADLMFKIWYIKDYLKEGAKRKNELEKLSKELEKLKIELRSTIIIEKVLLTKGDSVKKALMEIHEIGVEKFVKELNKSEDKKRFLGKLPHAPGDIDSLKKNMEVVLHFIDDKDYAIQAIVLQAIVFRAQLFDYEEVIPKLEKIINDKENKNQYIASKALSRIKSVKQLEEEKKIKKEESEKKDKPPS